jgi:hypothetical protein
MASKSRSPRRGGPPTRSVASLRPWAWTRWHRPPNRGRATRLPLGHSAGGKTDTTGGVCLSGASHVRGARADAWYAAAAARCRAQCKPVCCKYAPQRLTGGRDWVSRRGVRRITSLCLSVSINGSFAGWAIRPRLLVCLPWPFGRQKHDDRVITSI